MNRVSIDRVSLVAGEDSGFTIADDFANETEFHEGMPEDDIELVAFARKFGGPNVQDMLDFLVENERGIIVNNVAYSYEKIKEALNTESEENGSVY